MTVKRKEGSWKKALLWLAIGLAIGFFIGRANVALAKGTRPHNEWSKWDYSEWSECEPIAECGVSEGTQTRTKTRTCESKSSYGTNECEIVESCPEGYKPSSRKPSKCYSMKGGLHYVDKIYTPQVEKEQEERPCRVETPSCGTIRWCFPTCGEHEYEARAIPKDEKPEEGKPWETGMDRWCEKPEPTPVEPTPTPELVPTERPTTPAGSPQCTSPRPVLLPANPLVWRLGGTAIVQWQPTEGDRANIYYYENQNPDNEHAVRDTENDGWVEIGELGGLDWTFGVQQVNDCAGGDIVWVVDGLTSQWVLFTP